MSMGTQTPFPFGNNSIKISWVLIWRQIDRPCIIDFLRIEIVHVCIVGFLWVTYDMGGSGRGPEGKVPPAFEPSTQISVSELKFQRSYSTEFCSIALLVVSMSRLERRYGPLNATDIRKYHTSSLRDAYVGDMPAGYSATSLAAEL